MAVQAPQRSRREADTLTFTEHLGELRDRILACVVALAVAAAICFIFFPAIMAVVVSPYREATGNALIFTDPLDAFLTRVKVAAYGGFVLASPIVFWHLWRYVTPGLEPNEKRYAVPFVVCSGLLFIAGAAVAVVTFPKALHLLLEIGGSDLQPMITAGSYLRLVFLMVLAFGVAFEFPVLTTFLLVAGVVTTGQLRRIRRYTFLGIVIAAAVITPSQDPITLLAMAIPMYVLYEGSIVVGRLLGK